MSHPSTPRRTFLGNVLSGAAALWVSATGVLSTVLAACEPTTKYGGPPPESQPTVPIGGDDTGSATDTPSGETASGETASGETASGDAAAGGAEPTASAEPPAPVPKYGGPPPEPVTVKYGGPPGPTALPKYGGPPGPPPPIVTKYGGPPMTTKYGGPRKYGGPPYGF